MAEETIEIVRDGDVVLVVTDAGYTVRFKVHSYLLRSASEVFASLLGPNFAEGQALAKNSPSSLCEISLKNDNTEAMGLILNIIHFRHDRTPQRLTSAQIIGVAVLTDKYLLNKAMPFSSSNWFMPTKDDDLHIFLRAAIVLGHAESFKETTRLMILHQPTSFTSETCAGQEGIVLHAILKVEKRRDDIRHEMMREFNPIVMCSNHTAACSYMQRLAMLMYGNFDKSSPGATKLRTTSLEHGFNMMMQMFCVDEISPHGGICGSGHPHTPGSSLKQAYQNRLTEVMKFDGLCLDCEQEAYEGERGPGCRFGHAGL